MDYKEGLIYAFVLSVLISAGFLVAHEMLMNIDVETLDPIFGGLVSRIQVFFLGGTVSMVIVWLRNLGGFFRSKARAMAKGTNIEYNMYKYLETASEYIGLIAIVFQAAPTAEWKAVGSILVVLIEVLASELNHIFK